MCRWLLTAAPGGDGRDAQLEQRDAESGCAVGGVEVAVARVLVPDPEHKLFR